MPRGLAALLGLPDERVADAGAAAAGEVLAGALRADARVGALPGRPLADLSFFVVFFRGMDRWVGERDRVRR